MLIALARRAGWSKRLLLLAALFQSVLPLSVGAAMQSASPDSPFYCGQMSPQLWSQARGMDLPAELLKQLRPPSSNADCSFCISAPSTLIPVALPLSPSPIWVLSGMLAFSTGEISPEVFDGFFAARAPPA